MKKLFILLSLISTTALADMNMVCDLPAGYLKDITGLEQLVFVNLDTKSPSVDIPDQYLLEAPKKTKGQLVMVFTNEGTNYYKVSVSLKAIKEAQENDGAWTTVKIVWSDAELPEEILRTPPYKLTDKLKCSLRNH